MKSFYGKLYVFNFWSAFVWDQVCTILWRQNLSAINMIWILRIFSSRDATLQEVLTFSEKQEVFLRNKSGHVW